jgi:hypothetical protein
MDHQYLVQTTNGVISHQHLWHGKSTKESFMSNQTLFNELKLRVGYGETGNQQGLNPQSINVPLVIVAGTYLFWRLSLSRILLLAQNANADLKWETKKQTNIGLDFALLDNRLRGSVDVYDSTTDNLII